MGGRGGGGIVMKNRGWGETYSFCGKHLPLKDDAYCCQELFDKLVWVCTRPQI